MIKKALIIITTLVLVSYTAGCGGKEKKATPDSGQERTKTKTLDLVAYYVKYSNNDTYLVREVHHVPYTTEVASAAMGLLIKKQPVTEGAVSVLPADTRVLGIKTADGLATVDFSKEVLQANVGASGELLGIQSVVNTLCELPEIKEVSFQVEGAVDDRTRDWWGHVGLYNQPFQRNLEKVYEPSIWVTHPTSGQAVGSPLLIKGSAMVFEGTVNVRLLDEEGGEITEGYTTATSAAPYRGEFEMEIKLSAPGNGMGTLEVFWISPEDGKPKDVVKIPILWP